MKNFAAKVILTGLINFPLVAGAGSVGGVDGGGGMGYVCYAKDSQTAEISQVFVLDFYEALVLRQLSFSSAISALDTATLVNVMKDLIIKKQSGEVISAAALASELASINGNLFKSMLPNGVRLPPVTDGDAIIKPQGCERDQLAYYRDNPGDQLGKFANLLIVGDYWGKMDNLNRATLLVHEAVYRVRRESGDINSDATRTIVGECLEQLSNL